MTTPPTPVEIRRLAAPDLELMERLLDVFGEAFEDPEAYCARRPRPEYQRRLLGRESVIALVALARGEVVGGLVAYELPKFEQERSEVYLYDLAVSAAHRRRGVATTLIARLREVARSRGAHVVFVQADTGEEDAPAIALYSRLGRREEVLHFDLPV